ncbi:MAG TPA: hypothetical protein DEF45_23770 [Rhodopirellula sp.]|nr:hypothetical protein [Rhodopirellula sp.]
MQFWRITLMHACTGLFWIGHVIIVSASDEDPELMVEHDPNVSRGVVIVAAIPSRARKHIGTYRIGRDIRVKIDLKNSLGSQLNLRAIDPDCGCLAVEPKQCHVKPGEHLTLSLRLDASNKIATIRRSIRVFFHESIHPFVLDIDVRMTGPVVLSETTVQLASPAGSFVVSGRIEEPGGRVQKIESLRGSFVISDPFVQSAEVFKFSARPTFSFGDVDDLVRIHYRNPKGGVQVIDLPIHLRFTTPLRFLPSTLHLDLQSTGWVGTVRMIVVPGKLRRPLNQLSYVVESKSRPGQLSYKVAVRVHTVSSIMSVLDVLIAEEKQVEDRDDALFPDRLLVYGSNKEVVGILNLVREGEN